VSSTLLQVPLERMLEGAHFDTVTTEVFGPFQVVTEYGQAQLPLVLQALERMNHHLTAAIVSNDVQVSKQSIRSAGYIAAHEEINS
jgi:1-pyrroline-5-carboxylate dehydrogenase